MKLRLILGDQLNMQHTWLQTTDANTLYLMAEMRQETDYVPHHIQKVVAFFLSMRNFANTLKANGHKVFYYTISNKENMHDLAQIITKCVAKHAITQFEY